MQKDKNIKTHAALNLRRTRLYPWSRALTQETRLHSSDLILPLFIIEGENLSEPIPSMPDVERLSIDRAILKAQQAFEKNIPLIALFPCIALEKRDEQGSEALNENNLICRAIKAIKNKVPDIGIMSDIALDPYTSHGHDGFIENGHILNAETVNILVEQALLQAKAGSDIIAPSDMMDGRIGAIRSALNASNYDHILQMSYCAKYASSLYGPFREAVKSGSQLTGDKKTYQMSPANRYEAYHEAATDCDEQADMLLIKPGIFYLDILSDIKKTFKKPTFAYQVSGEYTMLKLASKAGVLDANAAMLEALMAFKRAGADGILTYDALNIVDYLEQI